MYFALQIVLHGIYIALRLYYMIQMALHPLRERTYEVVDALLGELASLFPDEYVHLGGDEVDGECLPKAVNWRQSLLYRYCTNIVLYYSTAMLGELFSLFPDEYVHSGGDEVDGECLPNSVNWRQSPLYRYCTSIVLYYLLLCSANSRRFSRTTTFP